MRLARGAFVAAALLVAGFARADGYEDQMRQGVERAAFGDYEAALSTFVDAAAIATAAGDDDPGRFAKSASVGAYLGLTPRRHQSGEAGWTGRISKRGDGLARHMLYEAANSLMVRVRAASPLKAWAQKLARTAGPKKARVALARKLAVILHRLWVDGTTFRQAPAIA